MVSALTLKYDEPLSNVAFNFNLRRYSTGVKCWGGNSQCKANNDNDKTVVRQCRFTVSKPVLKAPVVSAISA